MAFLVALGTTALVLGAGCAHTRVDDAERRVAQDDPQGCDDGDAPGCQRPAARDVQAASTASSGDAATEASPSPRHDLAASGANALRIVGGTVFGVAYAPWFVVEWIGWATNSSTLILAGLPVVGAMGLGIDWATRCWSDAGCWTAVGFLFADTAVQITGAAIFALADQFDPSRHPQARGVLAPGGTRMATRWMLLPGVPGAPAGVSVVGAWF